MITDYLCTVAFITTAALVWRTLLLDHPALLASVERIPLVGGALRCGFCAVMWFSLAGVIMYNPLMPYLATLTPAIRLGMSWFIVGAGVLFLRNLIAVLMEGAGVLTHLHRSYEK